MAKFIIRRLLLMLLTMFLVSVAVFVITESAPGNVARNVLGIQITPEQEASFLAQNGLDKPIYLRYIYWLLGTDWHASAEIGLPVKRITTQEGFTEWWVQDKDGTLMRWEFEGEDLIVRRLQPDGTIQEAVDNGRWQIQDPAQELQRLEEYRAGLVANQQLVETDRQAILQQLDRIVEILGSTRSSNLSQAGLNAALAEPEAALQGMIDDDAMRSRDVFQGLGQEMNKRDSLIPAAAIYQTLAKAEAGDLRSSDVQTMARKLSAAATAIQDVDPATAKALKQAAESLQGDDLVAARDALAAVNQRLEHLTGSLGILIAGLQNGDYQQATAVLHTLSDPAQTSFDADQLALLPDLLKKIGNLLQDGVPGVGDPLVEAAGSLADGNLEGARAALGQAAEALLQTGQAIVRSDAASGARVGRTFWGVDLQNHAVRWEKGTGKRVWVFIIGTGWKAFTGGPQEYIPLQKGMLRGDPGLSLRTGRPVADLIFTRLRNSLVLAGLAFAIVMPLALLLGLIAGIKEGKLLDRALSIGGMMFSVTPEFATGIFLILIFAFWLKLVPGATVFGEDAPWTRPDMLVLPVATLTLIELGYVLRITRASMVEVMKAPYIRTAFLKGLPFRRVVFKHAIRNALMAPITVIMLHVNWLLGGIVVVEVIFGYPGLGSYLLDSALFKDFNAIEAGAIILVAVAVGTQLLADIVYTFLNPRIRYA
jgi:ABC-type dipeptide/oligopeptide/nickel transport system permease component